MDLRWWLDKFGGLSALQATSHAKFHLASSNRTRDREVEEVALGVLADGACRSGCPEYLVPEVPVISRLIRPRGEKTAFLNCLAAPSRLL